MHLKILALAAACACTLIPSALADPGVVPPPTAAWAAEGPEGVTLTWEAPPIDGIVVGYTVYREGHAIASVTDTRYVDPAGNSTNVYEIRSVDAEGHQSAPVPATMLESRCLSIKTEAPPSVKPAPEDCVPASVQTVKNLERTLHPPVLNDG